MAHALDIDQLRTFVAIAEVGSFTRAAETVNKTQSAVSMQMRRLEERIGRPIFVRQGRASRLTDEGKRLMEFAQRMVRLNDETMTAFTEADMRGSIRLGIPDDYADRLLPQVLAGFARIYPTVEIQVDCSASSIVTERIRNGELELGIVTSADTGGLGEVIRREQLYWVTAAGQCVHEIDPLPLALAPSHCAWRISAISALDQIGRAHRIAYSSQAAVALSGAVVAGLAVTVLPESAIRSSMRILTERDGFPPLPNCDISLLQAVHATHPEHYALADHIAASLGNLRAAA